MCNEKQQRIVEMAKDICRHQPCCNDVCKPISACDALRYAERAIEAGYIKRSEGEWNDGIIGFCNVCMSCGAIVERSAIKNNSGKLNFCPNCGAKMKGGA